MQDIFSSLPAFANTCICWWQRLPRVNTQHLLLPLCSGERYKRSGKRHAWLKQGSVPLLKDPWKITSERCQGWWFPFCQPICALKMPPWSTEGCMVEMSLRARERPWWDLSIKTSQAPSSAHLFSWLRTQYLQPDPLFWTSFWKAKWWLLPQDSCTTQLWKCWSDAS